MGKYTPAFNIWTLATLGIDAYAQNTLGIYGGLLIIGFSNYQNLIFLPRFSPNYSYLSSEMHMLIHPKMALHCITRVQWNLVTHSRWRFAVLHVPTHSGSNTLFTHARDNRVSQGLHRTAGAGSRCDAPRRDVTAARFAHLVAERVYNGASLYYSDVNGIQ